MGITKRCDVEPGADEEAVEEARRPAKSFVLFMGALRPRMAMSRVVSCLIFADGGGDLDVTGLADVPGRQVTGSGHDARLGAGPDSASPIASVSQPGDRFRHQSGVHAHERLAPRACRPPGSMTSLLG